VSFSRRTAIPRTTQGLAVQLDPVRKWREEYARRGTRLGFEPSTGARFYASVRPILDAPRMVRTRLSPGLLIRDADMIRDGDDRLNLVVTQTPRYTVWHRGRELCLGRGDATLFQADAPGRSGAAGGFAVIELSMAQADWAARNVSPAAFLMQHIRRDCEGLTLLAGYVRSLDRFGPAVTAEARDIVRHHVLDLAILAATRPQAIGESNASAVMAARRAAVLEHIARHFSDPELSVTKVAQSLRISPRYVQRLLATFGTSFTAYVTELRLQQTFRMLTENKPDHHRISDIALEAGFSDISYFNRRFRARFGDTPRGVRAQFLRQPEAAE
jgi:AraC-like DNA-binding protein